MREQQLSQNIGVGPARYHRKASSGVRGRWHKGRVFMKSLLLTAIVLMVLSSATAHAATAYIQVKSEPDVRCTLDGQMVGMTRADIGGLVIETVSGNHQVLVEKDGYEYQSFSVMLSPNQVYLVTVNPFRPSVKLTQEGNAGDQSVKLKTGSIIIQSLPVECTVEIPSIRLQRGSDQSRKLKDQWILQNVPIGTHTCNISDGQRSNTFAILVAEGCTSHYLVDLFQNTVRDLVAERTLADKKATEVAAIEANELDRRRNTLLKQAEAFGTDDELRAALRAIVELTDLSSEDRLVSLVTPILEKYPVEKVLEIAGNQNSSARALFLQGYMGLLCARARSALDAYNCEAHKNTAVTPEYYAFPSGGSAERGFIKYADIQYCDICPYGSGLRSTSYIAVRVNLVNEATLPNGDDWHVFAGVFSTREEAQSYATLLQELIKWGQQLAQERSASPTTASSRPQTAEDKTRLQEQRTAELPKLTVHVIDEKSQPLQGVQVALYLDENSGASQVRRTDAEGNTAFAGLQPGRYIFVLSYTGYAARRKFNFQYNGGNQAWETWLKPSVGPSVFSPDQYDAIQKMNEYPD